DHKPGTRRTHQGTRSGEQRVCPNLGEDPTASNAGEPGAAHRILEPDGLAVVRVQEQAARGSDDRPVAFIREHAKHVDSSPPGSPRKGAAHGGARAGYGAPLWLPGRRSFQPDSEGRPDTQRLNYVRTADQWRGCPRESC